MNSAQIVLILIAISTFVSVFYLVRAIMKRSTHRIITGLCMIASPMAGPLFFCGTCAMNALFRKGIEIKTEGVTFSKEWKEITHIPDVSKELNTVPLEDVLLVSAHDERRRYLLDVLKKSANENYTIMLKGLDNDDTETVHYAASTISKAKENFENTIREFNEHYCNGSANDPELIRKFTDYLLKYIRSGILIDVEKRKYSNLYVSIMEKADSLLLTEQDYVSMVNELLWLGEYEKAKDLAIRAFELYETEEIYIILAKCYYSAGNTESFNDLLEKLKSSDITFSSKTLDLVRFFSN